MSPICLKKRQREQRISFLSVGNTNLFRERRLTGIASQQRDNILPPFAIQALYCRIYRSIVTTHSSIVNVVSCGFIDKNFNK